MITAPILGLRLSCFENVREKIVLGFLITRLMFSRSHLAHVPAYCRSRALILKDIQACVDKRTKIERLVRLADMMEKHRDDVNLPPPVRQLSQCLLVFVGREARRQAEGYLDAEYGWLERGPE